MLDGHVNVNQASLHYAFIIKGRAPAMNGACTRPPLQSALIAEWSTALPLTVHRLSPQGSAPMAEWSRALPLTVHSLSPQGSAAMARWSRALLASARRLSPLPSFESARGLSVVIGIV